MTEQKIKDKSPSPAPAPPVPGMMELQWGEPQGGKPGGGIEQGGTSRWQCVKVVQLLISFMKVLQSDDDRDQGGDGKPVVRAEEQGLGGLGCRGRRGRKP